MKSSTSKPHLPYSNPLYASGKMKMTIKILTIILLFGLYSCDRKSDRQEYAEMIIEKVYIFKKENNRLPKNVSEIGLIELEDSPAFYEQKTDSTFIVWFGLSVGESKVYSSLNKKWNIEG